MSYTPFKNVEVTSYLEQLVAQRKQQLDELAITGVSAYRNEVETAGSATITLSSSIEVHLQTGVTPQSSASLRTKQKGNYFAGYEMEASLGLRVPSSSRDAGELIEWGYFDDVNGFGYGVDETDVFTFRNVNGTQVKTYAGDWVNSLPDARATIVENLNSGTVSGVEFSWYGYGAVEWYIQAFDSASTKKDRIVLHREVATEGMITGNPNLPLKIRVANGASSNSVEAFIGGRSIVSKGQGIQNARTTVDVATTTYDESGFTPSIAARKKSVFPSIVENNVGQVSLRDTELYVTEPTEYRIRLLSGTIGGSWNVASGTLQNESAAEFNLAPVVSEAEGGSYFIVDRGFVAAGSTTLFGGLAPQPSVDDNRYNALLGTDDKLLLEVRALTTGSTTAQVALRLREDW